MTEAEWLAEPVPRSMVAHLLEAASERKLRLLMCATGRLLWRSLPNKKARHAIRLAEKWAEGRTPTCLVGRVVGGGDGGSLYRSKHARDFAHSHAGAVAEYAADPSVREAAEWCVWSATSALAWTLRYQDSSNDAAWTKAAAVLRELIRDVFGNPFREFAFDFRWRTTDAVGLAGAIYEDRAFDRMPILADALMDAGCEDKAIISHCRDDCQHVRGCWVVDLVLGKE